MAVEPGIYNIRLYKGSDWKLKLEFKDSTDAAVDLTGYTVAAQIWNQQRSKKFADFSVSHPGINDRANGVAFLELGDTDTKMLPDLAYYDVRLTNTDNKSEYYLKGSVTGLQGYTQ